MRKLPLEVIIPPMDCRDYCSGNIFHGLHNRTHIFFTIYGVGVISEFYVATGESMEKIHEPNRPLVGSQRANEALAVEVNKFSYPSYYKVPKFHVNSLTLPSTAVRPYFPPLH